MQKMSSDAESTIVRATYITPNGRPYTAKVLAYK